MSEKFTSGGAALLLAAIVCLFTQITIGRGNAGAAEIRLFVSMDRDVLEGIVPEFEQMTGHRVLVQVGFASSLEQRIKAGELYDVAVATSVVIDGFVKQAKIVADTRANLARSGIGVAVKSGVPKPDVATAGAFRKTLIETKSLGYIDPTTGGAAAEYVPRVLDRLGIAAEMKSKTTLFPRPPVLLAAIARGEIAVGITQTNRILAEPGAELVGPLPQELQLYTLFVIGALTSSKEREAALSFIKYITSPAVAPLLRAKGLDPG